MADKLVPTNHIGDIQLHNCRASGGNISDNQTELSTVDNDIIVVELTADVTLDEVRDGLLKAIVYLNKLMNDSQNHSYNEECVQVLWNILKYIQTTDVSSCKVKKEESTDLPKTNFKCKTQQLHENEDYNENVLSVENELHLEDSTPGDTLLTQIQTPLAITDTLPAFDLETETIETCQQVTAELVDDAVLKDDVASIQNNDEHSQVIQAEDSLDETVVYLAGQRMPVQTKVRCKPTTRCPRGTTRIHKCEICNRVFTSGHALRYHKYVHIDRYPFFCKECNKGFYGPSTWKQHIRGHHRNERVVCTYCNAILVSNPGLRRHQRECCPGLPKQKICPCPMCGKQYRSANRLKQHMKIHDRSSWKQCTKCDKSFSYMHILQSHIKHVHSDVVQYECDICQRVYKYENNMKAHRKNHASPTRVKCKECDEVFTLKSSLVSHIKAKHMPTVSQADTNNEAAPVVIERVACNLCGILLAKHGMKKHQKYSCAAQTQKCVLSCTICKKKLATQSTLTRHMYLHDDKKQLTCDKCGKDFTSRYQRNEHRKTYHPENIGDKSKQYACNSCERSYLSSGALRAHKMQKHPEDFIEHGDLADDVKAPSPPVDPETVDVVVCSWPLCDRMFQNISYLHEHEKKHTKNCKKCGKYYSSREALDLHMEEVH